MIGLAALAIGVVAFQGNAAPPKTPADAEAEFQRRVKVWESACRDAFKGIDANLLVDIERTAVSAGPIRMTLSSRVSEAEYIDLIADQLRREVVVQPDGWVLRRSASSSDTRSARYRAVLQWLSEVPDPELRSLVTTGVPYAYLPPKTKRLFSRFCNNQGLGIKMANGDFVAASVQLSFVGTTTDRRGGEKVVLLDLLTRFEGKEIEQRNQLANGYRPPPPSKAAKRKRSNGSLVFDPGTLVTMADLARLASQTFGKPVTYDTRLGSSLCYVQGRFTESAFVRSMKTVSQTVTWSQSTETVDDLIQKTVEIIRRRLPRLLDPSNAPPGIKYEDVLEGGSLAASAASAAFPGLAEYLNQIDISPNATFALSPAITFQLFGFDGYSDPADPPGSSPIGNGWSATFGNLSERRPR